MTFRSFNIDKILSCCRNTTQTSAPRAPSCPAARSSASPSPGPSSETPRSSSWMRPLLPWTRRARRWASLKKEQKTRKEKQSPLAESARFVRRLLQILQARRAGVQLSLPLPVIIIHHLYYYQRWWQRWRLTVQSAPRYFKMDVVRGSDPLEHFDDSDQAPTTKLR